MSIKLVELKTHFDPQQNVWSGLKKEMQSGPDVSAGRSVLEALLKHPDHINQICHHNGRQYTNKEIATLSIRVAQNLQKIGIQQEDVIAICASNTDFIAPLIFGALLCGIILNNLDPSFGRDTIRHIFSITKPKIVFCDGKVYKRTLQAALADAKLNIPFYIMKDSLDGQRRIDELVALTGKENSFKPQPLKLGSKQTASIMCSSGTTGLPKAVRISHECLLNSCILTPSLGARLLSYGSVYWSAGMLLLLQGSLHGFTRVIVDKPYSPELCLRMVEEYNINLLFATPSQLAITVQSPDFKTRNLSSLSVCHSAGAVIPLTVLRAFKEHAKDCKVYNAYGMSEAMNYCSFGIPTAPGDSGQLMANYKVKLTDDSGKRLGIFERGEILIKTPYIWAGYYNDPEATKAIYDPEGWIQSGDIGYFNDEGCLHIVDRKKDIFKYDNFHYYPTEIEELIIQIPDVVEVCICGIQDSTSNFLPAAAVVTVPNSKLTEDDISNYVAERMDNFKRLRGGVYFLQFLPKTGSGKNVRRDVRQILKELWQQKNGANGLELD